VLNAVWTAIVLSIPVTILQDAMGDRIGVASSLYTSSFQIGILLGGATAGVVAEWFGFTNVFFVCAVLTAAATVFLAAARPGRARDEAEGGVPAAAG
jgi:SET family sugar efflux transporter-like MFS transporter